MAAGRAFSDTGLVDVLSRYLSALSDNGVTFVLRLFANNVTVGPGVTIALFNECTFPGYVSVDVDPTVLSNITVAGNIATALSDEVEVFTNSGQQPTTIYGYYMTQTGDFTCEFAESFAEPIILAAGQMLNIRPAIRLRSREY